MEAKTRKIKVNLITLGTAVIVFCVWTVVKLLITYLFIGTESSAELTGEQTVISNIILWGSIAVSFLLNCYVGLSARALGKGKKKNSFFLVVAGAIASFRTLIVILEIVLAFLGYGDFISLITSAFIDTTTIVFLVEVMVNSIHLKTIIKNEPAKEGNYEL